ncbi:MAG TPA: ROK family transcriptional regulator [Deinococcales bacterium]|nr:ROK family transcriptional regulator [Deinococcales bacterium]
MSVETSPTDLSVRTGRNLPLVRAGNLSAVLDAIRKLQPISRGGLSETVRLTPATVTRLVDELARLNLLLESPSPDSQLGRRPSLIELNPRAGSLLGVELSRSAVRAVLTDFRGRALKRAEEPVNLSDDPQDVVDQIASLAGRLRRGAPRLLGVGLGVPGPVNSAAGIVLEPPNFGNWRNVPLAELVSRACRLPVWLDDDAKTAALGERWFGAGRGRSSLLYVSLGVGVGSGLIVNDEVYRGRHELAGEIGHTTLDVNGPACPCGNRGCVETLVSVPAILGASRRRGLAHNLDDLIARSAEPDTAEFLDEVLAYLAAMVVNAVNHLDPELIVMGGSLVRSWPGLVDLLRERVSGRLFGFASRDLTIVPASLGQDASALGAACLVADAVMREPGLASARTARAARQPA